MTSTILYMMIIAIFIFIGWMESQRHLHMAQLEGYKPSQYMNWIRHNKRVAFLKRVSFHNAKNSADTAKKPLAYTHRAIRLMIVNGILLMLWLVLSCLVTKSIISFALMLIVINCLIPLNMLMATFISFPMEMLIQKGYYRDAQIKIRSMKDLVIIGITGSYGKTSTKYFLKTILSERFNTLMTPESYNTPMGITRVIREQLTPEHEVFVCEMGARNKGDIRELTELTHPSIGILTSVGPQHLETFKNIETIKWTKYELIDSLPENGTAVFNGDNAICRELAENTSIETLVYSVGEGCQDSAVRATDITITEKGLNFKVMTRDGISFECQTGLLGKHNVSNILGSICVALKLGLTAEQIQNGISKIKPVPHRLELLPTTNGVIVIDDAFNSNPTGAKEALETIRALGTGNKIVITPGMVELGQVEAEENRQFGRIMAECCDYALLIGPKRSKPIVEGLLEKGFLEDRIIVVQTLKEATAKLGQLVKAGDVVLFENDLPDNYDE